MTHADRAFLDTNVLLAATDIARPERERALDVLNGWPAHGATLYASGQVLREYLAVATRPSHVNGLGLSAADALDNARAFASRLRHLDETESVWARLTEVLADGGASGKHVHDANLVATMLAHGARTLVTLNVRHFARFGELIEVREP